MSTASTIKHAASDLSEGISNRLHDAGERIVDLKDDAARVLSKRARTLGAMIQEHPFAAAAIGLGVGYLVFRLVRR
jgi:ElaB/YqjD/DUF883 family membrane-anchored ribosome-binding protein